VSKTRDPVAGGWNYYSINTPGGLGDYPKLGIWPDGIYMSVNMFGYPSGAPFQNPRVYAFNKAQMYAGSPTVQVVSFNAPAVDFALLPSNARLQTGTPPAGTPNYFVSTWQFLNALTVYKFHVDWNRISLSTFTGPDSPLAATSWPNAAVPNAPSQGGNSLDVLQIRAMMQNQYSNIGGVESLWTSHTVRRANTTGFAAPRWYQVNVTGGTVAANIPQAATWDPDGANVIHRFMPSVAVDRAGNMALGYSTSSSTTKPAIKYAGRLAADPVNTLGQTEQLLIQGAGTQTGSCGGTCSRWGDYSAMSLDPDGCTFWYSNMYYATDGLNHQTRIGSFRFPGCTQVGAGGTVAGTVTVNPGGAPISGAIIALGNRTTTTDGSGFYQFLNIPAGTYPSITASAPGYNSSTATNIVVTDGATTTQNFSLSLAPVVACLTDTTQADFQTGVSTNVDLATSPGDVILANISAEGADQVSSPAALSTTNNLSATTWTGQTFRAGITGNLTKITVGLGLASGTSGTITVEIRNLNGVNPGTTVLATSTLGPVTNVGTAALYTTTFATPAAVVSGTSYSVVLRNSVGNTVFGVRGSTAGGSTLANGQVFTTTNSGTVWTAIAADLYFTTFVTPPFAYAASGNLVSGTKDANPAMGATPHWTTLSWTATIPANTDLKFQVAGSNNVNGPFNFVGPDGTAATFFTTSGASLSQFDGLRYLQYKAYLSTTSTMTPTLNDVTVCFNNITGTISGGGTICAGTSTNVTVTVTGGTAPYTVILTNGGGTQTGAGPVFTFPVSPGGNTTYMLAAGSVDANSNPIIGSGSAVVTVTPLPPMPTITPGGPTTFCAGGSVTLTSSSATGNQWYLNGNPIGGATNQTYVATASGNYTVVVTASGCSSAASAPTVVTVNPIPPTPTITPGGPTTFCTGGSVTLTSSSATGNQWYLNGNPIGGATNQTYVATASGDYVVVVTANGCPSAPSAATTVTVNPIPPTPTITPGGPTTFCAGGSVTLTSSSATGNQWYLNGNPIGGATNQTYVATASGNYTVIVTISGCASAASAPTTVTVNPTPPTPTITPGGPTTFCAGGSVTLTSSSATGNQWYLNGNPIGGATNQTYVATASGNYTVVVTASGCSSAASAPTTVTVNPIPPTPTVTPGGPTTFCSGSSVTLTSSSATGNQWYLNGNPIGGATNQTYIATGSGSYTVIVTTSGCSSAASAPTMVTVNPAPPTPTITPGGPTTFCGGGSVTLTSSSATGNQWYLNGNPIGGATNQTYVATASGSYTVVVTASGCSSAPSAPTTVTVNPTPPMPTITPGGPTTFCGGGSVTLTSSSATGNQWYLDGNPIGGATSQTYVATASGNYTVIVTTNGCASAASAATTVTVNVITVNPATLPSGTVGLNYNQSVSATPAGTYSFSLTGGALPAGLSLNSSTGAITGLPTTNGSFNFTITATGGGCTGSRNYTVAIGCPAISFTTTSPLPTGMAGVAYSQTINVTPAGSYTFSVVTGTLPSGLTLNSSTGVISGTPAVNGTYNFTVKAQASADCNATQAYTLVIVCPTVTVNPASLPNGTNGTAYSQAISATPAGGNYTFAVSAGSLPPGLNLNTSTGVLSGTPTTNGTFNFSVTATGFGSCASAAKSYSITIGGGGCPTITLPNIAATGTIGSPYSESVAASPSGYYTYTLTGTTPPGVTFYNAAALLYGYPTANGTYNFTVTATDSSNCTGSKSYSITIGAAFARAVVNDFDGDGKSDLVVWRGKQSQWVIGGSGDGKQQVVQWSLAFDPRNDVMACGDYDGDGKYDLASYRRSTSQWLIQSSKDGSTRIEQWGIAGDVPVSADYDGDGKADLAVWRGSEGAWYIKRSSDGQMQTELFGASGMLFRDVPVPADYDGDGKTDLAVFRQGVRQGGHWYIKQSSDGAVIEKEWGLSTDVPVAADYDGDGRADIAVWRGSDNNWYILLSGQSSDGQAKAISWGIATLGDVPAAGDYDGDGKADIAVWRASEGSWYIRGSRDETVMTKAAGQLGDNPVTGRR
jgi:hypothetical protein